MAIEHLTPGLGFHAALAVNRLKDGKPGDTVTRDEMSQVIQRSCSPGTLGYGNVNSAIKHVLTKHGVAWKWSKPLQSWVCLDEAGKVEAANDCTSQARRRATKSIRYSVAVDPKQLTAEQSQQHSVNMAVAGIMRMAGSSGFSKKLLGTVNGEHAKLMEPDPAKVIELMQRKA